MKAINQREATGPSLATVHDLLTRAASARPRPGVARLGRSLVVVADLVTATAAMLLVLALRPLLPEPGTADDAAAFTRAWVLVLPVWPALFTRYRLYQSRHIAARRDELARIVHAVGLGVVAMAVVAYALDQLVPRSWLVALFVVASAALAVEREVVRRTFTSLRRRGRLLRPVVIAGTGSEALALASMLGEQPELGYRVVGLIGDPAEPIDPALVEYGPVLDARSKVAEQVRMSGAIGVLVATTDVDVPTSNRLTRALTDAGIHVELSSSLKDIDATRLSVRPLGRFPVVYVEPVRRTGWPQVAKRSFDILLSLVGLVLAAPLLVLTAVMVKATSPGPVLYRQERVGYRGRRFFILKFRSMYIDGDDRLRAAVEALGPVPKFVDDPRVTPIGRVLRKLSIDELPQLVNVLRGEMSLVGPRPEQPAEVKLWTPELFDRLRVRPGLTGLWQVSGRSATRHLKDRWDLYYVDNWSMAHDVAILLRTIPVVLSSKGAY